MITSALDDRPHLDRTINAIENKNLTGPIYTNYDALCYHLNKDAAECPMKEKYYQFKPIQDCSTIVLINYPYYEGSELFKALNNYTSYTVLKDNDYVVAYVIPTTCSKVYK